MLILEDTFTPLAATLLRYFTAEGVACGHRVHWAVPSMPPGGPSQALPQLVKQRGAEVQDATAPTGAEQEEVQLRIAWQYRRYIRAAARDSQQQAASSSSATTKGSSGSSSASPTSAPVAKAPKDWCHRFDLTRPMGQEALAAAPLDCRVYSGAACLPELAAAVDDFVRSVAHPSAAAASQQRQAPHPGRSGLGAAQVGPPAAAARSAMSPASPASVHAQLTPVLGSRAPGSALGPAVSGRPALPRQPPLPTSIGRLVVQSLGSPAWGLRGGAEAAADVFRLIHRLKGAVRDTRCAAVVSVPTGLYGASFETRLQHSCDYVLAVEALRDDSDLVRLVSEPSSCSGLLRVVKLHMPNTLAPMPPDISLFVVRYWRRKLAIEAIEIDPNAEAAAAEAASGKSAAAALCGGPPQADNKAFDF